MLARLLAVSSVALFTVGIQAAEPASSPDFFEKRIRPLLAEQCLKCHGDLKGKAPKGGLRLDSRAAMIKGGDSGTALVPGKPEKSRLIEAVRYENTDLQMPPKGKLSEAQIADLVAWVKVGAVWPNDSATIATTSGFDLAKRKREHWAWQPVRATQPPAVRDSLWPKGSVDRFVLAELEEKGLKPAGPAERRAWIRRVTFDLIGLPPTPDEIDAFLADRSPAVRARVVDRLLASPHFGERWGRHWLDLVRYAETRGHEFDPAIPNAYEYRDYVIRALNADLPYNQFVREHIAGDLFDHLRLHPTQEFNESILGTGFWFLGEEVHSPVDIRQDQADRFDNRIDVLGKAFLGLTIACARCHDHKFDAISTRDYYSLYGFIESSTYRLVRFDSLEHNQRVADCFADLNRQSASKLAVAIARAAEPEANQLADYLLAARDAIRSGAALGDRVGELAIKRRLDPARLAGWIDATLRAAADRSHPLYLWAKCVTDQSAKDAKQLLEQLVSAGPAGKQQPLEADLVIDYATNKPSDWMTDGGSFGTGAIRPGQLLVRDGTVRFADWCAAQYDRAWDVLQTPPGTELDRGAMGKQGRSGRTIRTPNFRVGNGKIHYLVKGAGMAYAAVDGHTLIDGPLHGQLVMNFAVKDGFHWVTHDLTPYCGQPVHIEFTPAPNSDFAVAKVVQSDGSPPEPVASVIVPPESTLSPVELAAGYQRLFSNVLARMKDRPPVTATEARIANLWLEHVRASDKVHDICERYIGAHQVFANDIYRVSRLAPAIWDGNGVDENVFVRGSPKVPGVRVPRRFLEAIAGIQPIHSSGSGRLELANQMVDPALNPFIARVFVNRVWHHLFGRGIVASVDNFGVLGERPTHPELLDFLADRFVGDGWSLKHLIRDLVLSSTYAMSTQSDPAADQADPQNLLLHHFRLRRLEGEAIRDSMLAVSGRLNVTQYGRSVPIHLTPFLEGRGRPASGPLDGDGRRSIYLSVKRNFLSPMLLAFDTPIPFSTVGRRQVSNVPAQALILLNDPFIHQQAEVWAKAVLSRPGSTPERIRGMYLAAFGRAPSHDESTACVEFLTEQGTRYGTGAENVKPWADLAHMLFNTKDFLYLN